MIELDRDDMMEAISDGVSRAISSAFMTAKHDAIPGEPRTILEAIEAGVTGGIMQIARSATQMPGADFYDTIQKGIEEGFLALGKGRM